MAGGAVIEGVFRFILYILSDFIVDVVIRGTGYLLLKYVIPTGSPTDADPDSFLAVGIGAIVWALAIYGAFELYEGFAI